MTIYILHNIHKTIITITQTNPKVQFNPAVTLAHANVLKISTLNLNLHKGYILIINRVIISMTTLS